MSISVKIISRTAGKIKLDAYNQTDGVSFNSNETINTGTWVYLVTYFSLAAKVSKTVRFKVYFENETAGTAYIDYASLEIRGTSRIYRNNVIVDSCDENYFCGGSFRAIHRTEGGEDVFYYIYNNIANLGKSDAKFNTIYRTNEVSCALPTTNSAIDIFKKIQKPKITKGDYGERHYFGVDKFPDEMKFLNDKKEPDIELTRTLGVTVQAVRELIEKVEKLEKQKNKP